MYKTGHWQKEMQYTVLSDLQVKLIVEVDEFS